MDPSGSEDYIKYVDTDYYYKVIYNKSTKSYSVVEIKK